MTCLDLLVDGLYGLFDFMRGVDAFVGVTLVAFDTDTLHVQSRKTNVDNSSSMSTWVKWSLAMPLNVWLYLGRGDPIRLMCIPSSVNRKWDRNTDRVGDTNRDELTQNSVTPGDSTEKMPTNHYTLE